MLWNLMPSCLLVCPCQALSKQHASGARMLVRTFKGTEETEWGEVPALEISRDKRDTGAAQLLFTSAKACLKQAASTGRCATDTGPRVSRFSFAQSVCLCNVSSNRRLSQVSALEADPEIRISERVGQWSEHSSGHKGGWGEQDGAGDTRVKLWFCLESSLSLISQEALEGEGRHWVCTTWGKKAELLCSWLG